MVARLFYPRNSLTDSVPSNRHHGALRTPSCSPWAVRSSPHLQRAFRSPVLFPQSLPVSPSSGVSPSRAFADLATATAAGGAYRPPHARGTLTPTVFKREDEGGLAYNPANGANNFPSSGNGRTSPSFQSRGRRTIPGAAPPAEEGADAAATTSRRGKKKENQQKKNANGGSGASTPVAEPAAPAPPAAPTAQEVEAAAALSADDKKRRALMKKLTAIDQLKAKKAAGEKLELTQHKKLDRFVATSLSLRSARLC